MNSTYGSSYRVSIFGESHGKAIGLVIDGLPAGFQIDFAYAEEMLARRKPSAQAGTARREADSFEVYSGLAGGFSTGAPIMAMAANEDARSGDYEEGVPRPGHADLPAYLKSGGHMDWHGGGHFSGRLTAPLVFAGAIALQYLKENFGIRAKAEVESVHEETSEEGISRVIREAKERGDSVGGVIRAWVTGVPAGWGEPIFHSLESEIASVLFSIPAVKGVEFGDGFGFAGAFGSEVSDGIGLDEAGGIALLANHNGGVNAGMANGAPITFRAAVKPTPTIGITQETVDLKEMKQVRRAFTGRHDTAIVLRAPVVVEAAAGLALIQYALGAKAGERKEQEGV